MDLLSITASTIAVIQISSKLTTICYSYRSSVRHAPKVITEELQDLQRVLKRVS